MVRGPSMMEHPGISGNPSRRVSALFVNVHFFIYKKIQEPAAAGSHRFPAVPSLTNYTVKHFKFIIFSEKLETKVCDWLAYPDYSTNQTLSNFVLTNDLYHINAIEWSASAMEMSVIGAKNVANMIIEKYGISKEKNSNIHSRIEL